MLTPRSYPFIFLLFSFVLVVLRHIWYQSKYWSSQSIQNYKNHHKKKKPSLLCLPPLESYLCHFPYLVPKSCPIVVLSIRRPDIQANQRLQSKNPQSSLQIPCDYKDREKGNKSAAIVPHYHQEATTFRFGQILSRQLLCMPPPPPPWAVASTGPHHHHFSFAQCHAATISSASIDPISWGNPLVLSKPILIY